MRENERGTGWDMRGEPRHAIARVAVVPVLAAPEISSTQTSQYTLGHHLELTSKEGSSRRSEEHTSELQSRGHLVCRLLLEKKKPHQPAKARARKRPNQTLRQLSSTP